MYIQVVMILSERDNDVRLFLPFFYKTVLGIYQTT